VASFNWIPVAGAVSYDYYVGLYPVTPPSTSVTTTGTMVTFNGLTPLTKYEFCVRTNCSTGSSAWVCDTFTTIVAPPFCPQPSNVTANATGPHNIITGWTPVSGAVSYEYYLSTSPTPTPTGDTTIHQGVALSGLKSMGTYYFCVRTRCGGNNSSFWMCDTVYTPVALNVADNEKNDRLVFYPNPVASLLTVKATTPAVNNQLILTDVFGRMLYQSAIEKDDLTIDMSQLPAGIYILRLYQGENSFSHKIQKL
ncbi:MAG: Fibronectin type domain protein, partial [Flavipsychrobacter sp.]|nr:Fibronectin type domain protein [Flavipsychrobacter sp.]